MTALKREIWFLAGLILAGVPALAADNATTAKSDKEIATTFVAEVSRNTVAIFSNSEKERRCSVSANFSVMQNGTRVASSSNCFEKTIPAGKHVLVCDISNPAIVDAKIEGPVSGYCK